MVGRHFDLRLFLSVRTAFCSRVFREYCAGKLIDQKERSVDPASSKMEKLEATPKVRSLVDGKVAATGLDRLGSHGFVLR